MMTHVFVSEYLCSGACSNEELPESLAREGRAMLEAIVNDFIACPHTIVSTTWDARLTLPSFDFPDRVRLRVVASASEESLAFDQIAADADFAYLIAPEFDKILEMRTRRVVSNGGRSLNSTLEAIAVCSDKLQVWEACRLVGVATIETGAATAGPTVFPCVVKPRDGAGSSMMRMLRSEEEWKDWSVSTDLTKFIVQPFLHGTACSVAAIFNHGKLRGIFPPAIQLISVRDHFAYLGGQIPFGEVSPCQFSEMADKLAGAVPGLHGYIGMDFLVPDCASAPVLVEVNPRLTTSYVGYRKLASEPLTLWILDPSRLPFPDFSGTVRFDSQGGILELKK
ncbi:ATP-grasp domain-containing protein [Planctomicrobium sp. SH668]|uniref:ATP-grasp domain-containing protein n=1 Tax=Planctomicrobium sp. SH668 TaxID=3448126 RepID=UPI003F5BA2A7